MFQQIYVDALAEPAIGYTASPRFFRTLSKCPKCDSLLWARTRTNRKTIIGVTCPDCHYLQTYLTIDPIRSSPVQSRFDTGPLQHPPDSKSPCSG